MSATTSNLMHDLARDIIGKEMLTVNEVLNADRRFVEVVDRRLNGLTLDQIAELARSNGMAEAERADAGYLRSRVRRELYMQLSDLAYGPWV